MDVEIKENFLELEQFKELQNIITHEEFPWRLRKITKSYPKEFEKGALEHLAYNFYNNTISHSDMYMSHIYPILMKLKAKAVVQARANLVFNRLFEKAIWHTDHEFKCKTAILYLNSCDGGTEFKTNKGIEFIKADENKIVIFDSLIEHRAITSTQYYRYVLNLNYFI